MILSRVPAPARLALALYWILPVVAPAAVVASDLNPKPMGQYSTLDEPIGLALEGNRLLVACNPLTDGAVSDAGVQVVDVSDPTRPTPIGDNSAPVANGLVVTGNRLWLAADFEGLQSIDLAALATPDSPGLTIDRSGQVVRLSWPANATGFVLESSASVAPSAIWAAYDLPTETVGDRRNDVLAPSQRERFFRLKKP